MAQARGLIPRLRSWLVKTLYDLYPDLRDTQHLMSVSSETDMQAVADAGTSFIQAATDYNGYMWLQKAINILANNIAPLPVVVARGSGQDTEYLDNHPAKPLLDNPNPSMAPSDLWRQWTVDMLLGGEIGLEAVRGRSGNKVLELWPRQPQTFSVRPASRRYYSVAGYKVDDGQGDPYTLAPDQMVHFKFYNPLNPWRGITPVAAIRMSILIDQLSQVWARLFFRNSARPDFALIAPEGLTPTERAEYETMLSEKLGGTNAHKPIILEEGITDIKTFSWAPKDLEWMQQRQLSRSEVAAIIGVPDEIMGYGRNTYENFGIAERVLWTLTIVPLTGLRDGTLTRWCRMVGLLLPGERIMTDLRQVPQLQEDRSGKITQWDVLVNRGVPINVASEYLGLGLPTVRGGDVGYISVALVPIGTPPPQPAAPAAQPTETPAPEDELVSDAEQPGSDAPAQEDQPVKSYLTLGVPEYASEEHETLWRAAQSRLDPHVTSLQTIIKREFQRQQNEIGQRLRAGKDFGHGRFKVDTIPPITDLFDMEAENAKWQIDLRPTITVTLREIAQAELSALGISGVFDITRPEVVGAIRGLLETVSRKTNETTWSDLTMLFEEAEALGEGIPAIQERLSAYFGDRKSDYQTERIARTTTTGTSNAGTVNAWRQSEVVDQKSWISALQQGRTRQAHWDAHGQTVGLSVHFTVGGEFLDYPGDPGGTPGNIINCLCTQVAVIKGKAWWRKP